MNYYTLIKLSYIRKYLITIMLSTLTFLIVFLTWNNAISQRDNSPAWSWQCKQGQCLKVRATDFKSAVSLPACRLFCDPYGSLWPRPTGTISLGDQLAHVNVNSVDVLSKNAQAASGKLVREAGLRFKEIIYKMIPETVNTSGGKSLEVSIMMENPDITSLTLETDESYVLHVQETADGRISSEITAPNFFGARHGLETLLQLIIYDDIRNEIQIARKVTISDHPEYPYRGILLDTSRNYFSVDSIKRMIEGMATSKLNTFHWHITDSQSFPFVSKSHPELSRLGAYSPTKVYSPEVIKDIIEYARVRGVRVLPEFDAPAHVGEGWQDTDFIACFKAQPWINYCVEPPCGQFDPTKPELYDFLEGIYGDMVELFQPDLFHMGGDEVSLSCWNSTESIVKWMATEMNWQQTEADYMKLWNYFQSQAKDRLEKRLQKKIPLIMWTSTLTKPEYVEKYLPKDDYIIQIWTTGYDPIIKTLLDKKYRLIISNYDALYLDCGFESWIANGNNWCSPYIGWQKVYNNKPSEFSKGNEDQILGSESALWTEQVDDTTVDSRLWPRAAAMAETLWTDPVEKWQQAENRMIIHRDRLVQRGVRASAMKPQWCVQHQGECPI